MENSQTPDKLIEFNTYQCSGLLISPFLSLITQIKNMTKATKRMHTKTVKISITFIFILFISLLDVVVAVDIALEVIVSDTSLGICVPGLVFLI